MPTTFWTIPGPEWKATDVAFREVEKNLPSWLREEMRDAVDPLMDKARARVMRARIQGGPGTGHTGLRARVAAGVGSREGVGRNPYIRVFTSMADPSQAIIPRGLDRAAGWRHPLFGNKDHWFQSRPVKPGWFTDTFQDGHGEIADDLTNALERAASHLDAAS